jgi:hypothetical protein
MHDKAESMHSCHHHLPILPTLLCCRQALQRCGAKIAQRLSDADLLTTAHLELKLGRGLEHKHNRASETEPAHLLGLGQRLAVENRRGGAVHGFCICAERVIAAGADVRTEVL